VAVKVHGAFGTTPVVTVEYTLPPEPWDLAESFAIALEHPNARFLSLHEYWLSWLFLWGYWAGRWQRLLDALPEDLRKPPVIISECGIDGGLEQTPRPRASAGWRAYGIPEAEYLAQLTTYMASLDERVLGVCVFNSGDVGGKKPADRWDSFELAGEAVQVRRQLRQVVGFRDARRSKW
jgi:hypothetical protein